MVQAKRRRERAKPKSLAYTLPELARHWKLSWAEFVDRLCDPDTRVPVFADTTIVAGDRDCYGRLRKFADGKLLRFTGRERKFVLDPAGNKWPDDLVTTGKMRQPDLERVRDVLTGPPDEIVFLQAEGTGELFCATRCVFQGAFRVKVRDVEGYDRRPVLEAQDRARHVRAGIERAKGKPARTRERNEEMKTNVINAVLHAGKTLPEAMADVAKQEKMTLPQARRIVKPRALSKQLKNLRAS